LKATQQTRYKNSKPTHQLFIVLEHSVGFILFQFAFFRKNLNKPKTLDSNEWNR